MNLRTNSQETAMITITTLLAAAALAAGAPAPDAALPVTKAQAQPSRYAVRYDAKRDHYCLRDRLAAPVTGTRLVPQQCKTMNEWAAEGLIIGRKN
jgi:hypothetical protein